MQDIKVKLHANYGLCQQYSDYYVSIAQLLTENYETENTKLKKWLGINKSAHKHLVALLDSKPGNKMEDLIDKYVGIYEKAHNMHNSVKNAMDTMQQGYMQPINIRSQLSQTKIMELQDSLRTLKLTHARLMKSWDTVEVDLIELLGREIKTALDKIPDKYEAALHMQKVFRRKPGVIRLYARIMQDLVDTLFGESKPLMNKVLELIEDDKDYYLIENEKHTSKKNIHVTNPPIETFDLIPVTKLMPMAKLMSIVIPKQTNGKISMEKHANANSIGFIVMHRVVYHPVEYSARELIKPTDKSLSQPTEYGVTQKTIDKFNNIKQITEESKWDFSSKIVGDTNKMKAYYIIETLDGANYRALAPWFESNIYSVPAHKLKALIQYITGHNQPTRISSYQRLKSQQAISNMFLPKKLDLEVLSDMSIHIDMQQIQNALYENVMAVVRRNINAKYGGGLTIENNTHMNEIIHDPDIREQFYQTILKKYNIGTSLTKAQKYSAGDFPFSELLATYIKELRYITNRFMKELHNGYNRDLLNDTVFKEPKKEMKRTILDKVEEVIEKAILITVHYKNNIYSDMTYKFYLLNYT